MRHCRHQTPLPLVTKKQVLPAGAFQQRVALTILRLHYADEPEKGFTSPAPVHRLGRGTSGLLLCARDTATRRLLSDQFQAKTRLAESILETGDRSTLEASSTSGSHMGLEKIYLAVASGRIESDEGFIDARIGKLGPGRTSNRPMQSIPPPQDISFHYAFSFTIML